MAHKKGVGSTDNGRDSNPKYLGVKLFGGQYAKAGNIIVRQRGTKYHPGENVYMGRDHTLHAKIEGHVGFSKKRNNRTYVHILPMEGGSAIATKPKAKKAAAAPKAAVAPKAAQAKPAAPKAAAPSTAASSGKPDNLAKIEGIGPAIAKVLAAAGIITYSDLAAKSADDIKSILTDAGGRFAAHTPTTWPMQAGMAAKGEWDALKKWQDESDGGKPIKSSEEE